MSRSFVLALLLPLLWRPAADADEQLWTGNKLTPAQPFPAAVRAVQQSWMGYSLLLEEIDGDGRLCVARILVLSPVQYTLVADTKKELAAESERKKAGWIYISPPIEVSRFSWGIGPQKIGPLFGDDDLLRRVVNAEQKPTK